MLATKSIQADAVECEVDVDVLYETLSKLPAEIYLELYRKMHISIYGYPPLGRGISLKND